MHSTVAKFSVPLFNRYVNQALLCRTVFGIKKLVEQEKPDLTIERVKADQHEVAIDLIKKHYLPNHVLVRDRKMDLSQDCAIDEYITNLIKQGNSIYAKTDDGKIVGVCVGFASSMVDLTNLRAYAFYRQVRVHKPATQTEHEGHSIEYHKIDAKDPNTKDFMYFTAKLQETPNLWDTFKQSKIYEIRMLAVLPEYRRQGIATSLVETSMGQAHDQGHKIIRMNCINPYDFKVAERCMLSCIVKFPLHRLRGTKAPFVKRSSPNNCFVRVYVGSRWQADTPDIKAVREKQRQDFDHLME